MADLPHISNNEKNGALQAPRRIDIKRNEDPCHGLARQDDIVPEGIPPICEIKPDYYTRGPKKGPTLRPPSASGDTTRSTSPRPSTSSSTPSLASASTNTQTRNLQIGAPKRPIEHPSVEQLTSDALGDMF